MFNSLLSYILLRTYFTYLKISFHLFYLIILGYFKSNSQSHILRHLLSTYRMYLFIYPLILLSHYMIFNLHSFFIIIIVEQISSFVKIYW